MKRDDRNRTTSRDLTPGGSRAAQANARRAQRERTGRLRRVDAVVTPDAIAFRTRTNAVLLVFGLVWILVLLKGAWLGLGFDDRLTKRLASQHQRIVTVAPQRGSILDRLGRPLAVSVELGSAYADPSMVEDPVAAAELLGPILGLETAELRDRLARSGRFVWLARQVPGRISEAVSALGIDGVALMPESHREYPSGSLGAQMLGFVGIDGTGLEGLEARYDNLLMGDSFRYQVIRDGRRRATNYEAVLARRSTEGNTLVLTVDHAVQHRAEMALDAAVERHAARAGFVIVMDADTGALLAVASQPRFDPNAYRGVDPDAFRNRAVVENFEPGSTMKPFVIAEALERGLVTPDSTVYCEKGAYRIGRNVVHDTHPQEWLTVADVVKFSSNVGTAKLAEELGPASVEELYRRFGFGAKTRVDLYGEEAGILHASAGWARITLATHAFGQGLAVTGIQMAAGYAALVNGGHAVQPHVLAEVRSTDGEIVSDNRPARGAQLISEQTSAAMRPMLARVLEKDGTGWRASMGEYTAGGKTGTAQKVKDGRYAKGTYVSSFIGFAPVDAPRVVTYVVLDEPTNKYYGGTVAGPVFSEVTSHALRALGVAPDKISGSATLAVARPLEPPGASDPEAEELALPSLVEDGTGWLIPDLRGLSARDAVTVLGPAGAAVRLEGSGLVATQDPEAGAWIAEGDAVAIALEPRDPRSSR